MRQPVLERRDRKLDLAAHAAWLYYIAGNTQEEIAAIALVNQAILYSINNAYLPSTVS